MYPQGHILYVVPTLFEANILFGIKSISLNGPGHCRIDGIAEGPKELLITGIGMTNTAFQLGRHLCDTQYDWVIQLGIAGAFDRSLQLGQVVEVETDIFAEMGADSPAGFLDLDDLGFGHFEVKGEAYRNSVRNPALLTDLPRVRALTVNRVHGTAERIAEAEAQWQPQIESMEGAAFFQACLLSGVPRFAQIRAISNYVEVRDKEKWKVQEALFALRELIGAEKDA